MTFPTPGGNAPLVSQFTGAPTGLPSDWQDLPTTAASLSETIQVFAANWGSAYASAFQTWYEAAWKQDPNLTPNQAVAAYVTAHDITGGVGAATTALGKIPGSAAAGAENAVNNLTPKLPNLGSLFNALLKWTGAQNFLWRAAKVVIGGVLLLAGIIKMSGQGKNVAVIGATAAKVAAL